MKFNTEWEICHKEDFFQYLMKKHVPKKPVKFHLKYIQDVFAIGELSNYLNNQKDTRKIKIGEIGANHSRVLPALRKYTKKLFAIDVYDKEIGGGYAYRPRTIKYKIIETLVGDSKDTIEDEYFDVLFSISVVENVQTDMLKEFLLDSLRILKKDGVIIHLIDFYCNNDSDLQSGIVRDLIKNLEEIDSSFKCPIDDWSFKTSYCSNDDYTMWEWNSVAPHLEEVRNTHQSCSFILKISKE